MFCQTNSYLIYSMLYLAYLCLCVDLEINSFTIYHIVYVWNCS